MDFDKSSIERLKRTLYSRDEKVVPKEHRTPVSGPESDVPKNWGAPQSFDLSPEVMTKRNNSFFNKFLVISLIFFFFALGIAAFIFFGGWNMISSNNLDVKIVAPSSISSGEEFDMDISVVNANRTDLVETTLFVEYPSGAKGLGDDSKSLTRDKVDLGVIAHGGTKDYSVRALLFGEKDSIKTFNFRIEYKVKGSNAVFSKTTSYDVSIGSSPLLLSVDYPKEINSGQEVTLSVNITSNSSVVLSNTLVKVEYPYGFTYQSSTLKPLRDNSVWNIGDLKNGDKKSLKITGIIVGQNMEDRSFRVSAGTLSDNTPNDFDTALSESDAVIGIRKSFFGLQLAVPNDAVATFGRAVSVGIKWQNTLPDKIINSHIEATVSGNAFERNSVSTSDGGFFRSVDNTILWDKNTTNSLVQILPGDNGEVNLSLSSFANAVQIRGIKNPHIDLHVIMTGDRSGTDSSTVSSTADITLKILSTVDIQAKIYRNVGPFTNTGPIPPRVDKESTYTVTWTLTNTTNDLKGTTVSGTLPTGVSWKGETSPSVEKITYNPDNRVVTWTIGNVSAGTGFNYSAKTVSFKVGLIPSISQATLTPSIVTQIGANATDTYTNTTVEATAPNLNTQFSDPNFQAGNEIIQK